jgi:hypothetical protein
MGSLDVMGVVGTWVAVGLALSALLGVVGPLLVWRASKSARNRALARLDEKPSTSFGFVTPGLRLGPGTRLFRRVRVPILTESKSPKLLSKWKSEYTNAALPSLESAGWVQLGAVLRNYELRFPTKDALVLKEETMRLPVSIVWLFIFGLIGRFGSRSDSGGWIEETTDDVVVFEQALPGQRLGKRVRGRATRAGRGMKTFDAPPEIMPLWAAPAVVPERSDGELRGLTGEMDCYTREGIGAVDYKAHKEGHIKGLSEEVLDVANLFWLSMGCLPMADGRVFHLEDVGYPTKGSRSDSPTGSDYVSPSGGSSPSADPFQRTDGERYRRTPRFRARKHHQRSQFTEPRFWGFGEVKEPLVDFVGIADALGAEVDVNKRSLTDLEASRDEVVALLEDAKRTFIPCHHNWVRLGPPVPEGSQFSAFFLRRSDAQLLARVMLQLPICPQGYLVHVSPGSACRDMLAEACSLLPRILYFLVHHFDKLEARMPRRQMDDDFLPTLKKLLLLTSNYSYTRLFASVLYDLDCALVTTVDHEPDVYLFIQVLAMTSPEFRDLISQSLRDLEACLDSNLSFDAAPATISTYTIMGARKVFPLDLDVLLDDPRASIRSGTIQVPYVDVLLLVLKACLRSTFLETSLDSTPLFDAVFKPGVDVFEVC